MRKFLPSILVLAFVGTLGAAADAPVPAPRADSYLSAGEVDLLALLPPPPASGSAAQQRDVQAMLEAQTRRTKAAAARADADAEISLFRFADVLGASFSKNKLPKLSAFFDRVRSSGSPPVAAVKNYWHRPRPFVGNSKIHPTPAAKNSVLNDDRRTYSYSFPSGHATFGATCAIILANMVPEKRSELFARGWEYGENRTVGGVHYPSDVEAGRIDATVLVYAMMRNPRYQRDFAEAKAELRTQLGLVP